MLIVFGILALIFSPLRSLSNTTPQGMVKKLQHGPSSHPRPTNERSIIKECNITVQAALSVLSRGGM